MPKKSKWISCTLILFLACSEPNFNPSRGSLDWDYFPLETNIVSYYRIEETNYLGRGIAPEELEYEVMEEIVSHQVFDDGSIVYTLLESRSDGNGGYAPWRYFTVRKEFDKAVSNIENVETVELTLPLENGLRWEARNLLSDCPDGNSYCDFFEVQAKGETYTLDGKTYSSTVRVMRQSTLDPLQITKDHLEFAVYSQGSGLIYLETTILEFAGCRNGQNPDCCCPNNTLCTLCAGQIEFGHVQKKTLVERIFPD